MDFYLGTHDPSWLARTDVPLFISRRRLHHRRTLPRARGPWALDSGGFSELSLHGRWTVEPEQYADEVRRYAEEIGNLQFAAVMDWMCEPTIRLKTGLTTEEHQRRTIESYLTLTKIAPELPWAPVVQGHTLGDYMQHVTDYRAAGVDLAALPVVGVGSICRRQATTRASTVLRWLHDEGLGQLHGFGFKVQGLANSSTWLRSADSMAWSLNARRNPRRPGCTHASCQNCLTYALEWRADLLERLGAEERAARSA